MKNRLCILGICVILLFLLGGCTELPFIGKATGVVEYEPTKSVEPTNPVKEPQEDFFGANKSTNSVPDTVGDKSPQDTSPAKPSKSEVKTFCGDGKCNGNENCDTCKDCSCGNGALCHRGVCKVPECMTDEDCVDDDGCTPDVCEFKGHPNAFCSTDIITERTHYDGCCPKGAYYDVDMDCEPVCGDGRCEYGENEASCLEDCEFYGESGGGDASTGGGLSDSIGYFAYG